MAGEILSPEERAALLLQHKSERGGRTKDRIKVVLLRDDYWSYASIPETAAQPEPTRNPACDFDLSDIDCRAVWAFAAENPRLRLHYLPSYSPNLNAIEPAWKIMHEHLGEQYLSPEFQSIQRENTRILRQNLP